MKNKLRNAFLVTSFCLFNTISYGQTKEEALITLKDIFSKYFIKTLVYKEIDKKDISFTYEYEINDNRILIIKKSQSQIPDVYYYIPFEDMQEIIPLKKNDYFKKTSALGFKPGYGGSYVVSYGKERGRFDENTKYATSIAFPFEIIKGDNVTASIINCLNVVKREDKVATEVAKIEAEAAKTASDDIKQNTIVTECLQNAADLLTARTILKDFSLYNSENILVNMHEFLEKNRRFKDKPTLIVTWSMKWCNPCIKKIDELLDNGNEKRYNIVLVNKDGIRNYSDIKSKMLTHKPDYFTSDILFLMDKDNQLKPLDNDSAPMFVWLDNKLVIKGKYSSYDIFISSIEGILKKIE